MSKLEELSQRLPTHTLTTRIDGRYLATLIVFWRERNELPHSISELTRLSLESFTEFLVSNNLVTFVESHETAGEILRGTGLNPRKVNPKYLAQVLTQGEMSLNFLNSSDPTHTHKVASMASPVSSLQVNSVLAQMEEAERLEAETRLHDAQLRTSEFVKGLGTIPTENEK